MKKEAKALIKAIDDNTMVGEVYKGEKMGVVPIQYINEELEELKDVIKNE